MGSLLCMIVTFAYGEQWGTPQQNIVYGASRQGVGLESSPEQWKSNLLMTGDDDLNRIAQFAQ